MCSLNGRCDRATRTGSIGEHLPSIGGARGCGCPLPRAVAELSFAKGRHLFHQGDAVRGAFSLTAGLVAIERVDENGDMVILKILRPGALFPCADLFADGLHATGARAVTDVGACFIPTDRLETALSDPAIRKSVLRHGAVEARENEDIIFRLCAADLGTRILAVLRELASHSPSGAEGATTLDLPISWRELAAMVGTSPEVMSRTLRKLAVGGRLAFSGRRVTLYPELHAVARRAI